MLLEIYGQYSVRYITDNISRAYLFFEKQSQLISAFKRTHRILIFDLRKFQAEMMMIIIIILYVRLKLAAFINKKGRLTHHNAR